MRNIAVVVVLILFAAAPGAASDLRFGVIPVANLATFLHQVEEWGLEVREMIPYTQRKEVSCSPCTLSPENPGPHIVCPSPPGAPDLCAQEVVVLDSVLVLYGAGSPSPCTPAQ